MKWVVAGTSYHNILTSNPRWLKLEKHCSMTKLWYFARMGSWELHQPYIWKLWWLLMMIATQLNEGTFNIYIWEILEQRSSSTQRYYLILSWEGANARYTLFPFSMVFLTRFSWKGFNEVFNEAASRAHYEINVFVPLLDFSL